VTNDGTLIFNKSGSFTVGNIKTGPANGGTLVFNGPGTATLNNGNTYRNNTFINNGVVQLGAVDAIPSAATMVGSTGWLILDGGATAGTLDLNGLNPVVNALAGLNGAAVGLITNSASGTGTNVLTIDSTADTGYAGRIAGNSGGAKIALVKTGPYTEFLTGSSAFTGGVIISNGVLAISQGTSLGTGMITLKGGTLTNTASLNLYNVADLTVPAGQTGLLGMIGNFKMPNLFGAGNLGLNVGGVNAGAGSGSYGNAFGGCVNFLGTMNVTGTVANARLVLNYNNSSGASSDGQLQNATVNLYNGVSLVGLCFSGGGTVQLGALYVDSTSALGGSFNGGGLIYQIGALGGSSTIDGVVSNGIVGSAAITKVGSGTLTMNGSLTYTGPTTINGGTLALAGSANLDSGATITVASNSVLDVTGITFNLGNTKSQTLSGAGVVNGNINLGTSFLSTLSLTGTNNGSLTAVGPNALVSSGGSAAATLTVANDATFNDQSILAVSLSLNTTPGGGTNDLVKVGGNLSLAGGSGALYVRPQFLNGTPAIGQPYTIITYGGALTGDTNNLALDPSTFGYSHLGAIFNTSTPGVVTVSFTASPENIVWRGNYTNSWEASAMTNWLNGAATTNYYQFDNVTFNDAASNFVVSLNGLLTPSAVTVSNSANDYVFTNDLGGTLSGGIVLNKRGSGKLTLYTANPYTGGTTITNGGTVDISAQSAALGSGTLTMNGGTIISSVGGNGNPFPNKIILGSGTTNVLISNLGANTVYTNLSGGGGAALLQFQGASPDINNTNNFVGTIELTGASPTTTMRMRNEASASANVVWNIGNVGDTLGALIGGASNLKLGALVGGVSSTLGGYESGGGGAGAAVTWEIGALGQSTTFAGKIRDGNQTSGANTTAITKVGAGTLTLTGTNTYTGNTTVSNGTLELAQSVATLATNSTVAISSGAFLKLTAGSVTNQVAGLITNGVAAGNGLYTSANSSGYIIGSGQLRVGPAPTQPAIEPIQTSYNAGTGQLTLTWNNAGWTLQAQTNTLSTGLNPAGWVGVAGASSPYVISVNPTQPTVFYRLFAP
jgi:autotransporter-associated beta strand protein